MSSLAASLARPVGWPRWLASSAGVCCFAALTVLGAHVRVPLPGTPVPLTLQTLFVLAAGLFLGGRAGVCSQLLVLGAGAAGLPVFASGAAGLGVLAGPTGGYLAGFVVAPLVVAAGVRAGLPLAGLLSGELVVLALGTLHLAWPAGLSLNAALAAGAFPFVLGDTLKVLAAWVVWRGWGRPGVPR